MAEIARLEQEQQEKEHFWQEDIFNLKSLLIRAPDQQTIPADRCYQRLVDRTFLQQWQMNAGELIPQFAVFDKPGGLCTVDHVSQGPWGKDGLPALATRLARAIRRLGFSLE